MTSRLGAILRPEGRQAGGERLRRVLQATRQIGRSLMSLAEPEGRRAAAERLRRALQARYRIATQLYLGIGGAVVLTVAASLVGWFSFNCVGEVQNRVNQGSVPELVAAFGVAQHSSTLVAAAPRLTTAETPSELRLVAAGISDAHAALEDQLDILGSGGGGGEHFGLIQDNAASLLSNIEVIESERSEIFTLRERSSALRAELARLRDRLAGVMVVAVDDQLFYTLTGYRDLGESPDERSDHFSEAQLAQYRYLADLETDASVASHLLESAFSVSKAPLLEPLEERFESSAGRIERSLAAMARSDLRDEVAPILERLVQLGIGEEGGFYLLDRELRLVARQSELLELNRNIAVDLLAGVDGLVTTANDRAQEATRASTQAVFTGRTLLLAISALSVAGALMIAWLFVGRVLLRRLQLLSDWMRRMARGDLEAKVTISGRDEVADMAAALEVFRRHALEVQRLNLVEQLAEELQGKNEELESTLNALNRAQDQIVMREKLAALGELTAGVAHEIRNPLNFVKNFSEVSGELIVELGEVLEEGGENLTEDQIDLIKEISGDLSGNLDRIRSHGDRANRIVHDMLMMGRGSAEWRAVDINQLLEEYARLAYHSARATDSDFQLDLQQDLDPEAGELEVIPQDLGRVFLNIVGNACYATEEKRRTAEGPYTPTLKLVTRRHEDRLVVSIRDNGSGMPPEVVEKMFNPFFTTKPTGQGTGLGLAMSSDIVRQHGGSIRVETEPGEFTEMIIDLPLEPPARDAEEDDGSQQEGTSA